MPLSEYEQRVLEELEQQLRSDDPKLAETISGRTSRRPLQYTIWVVVLSTYQSFALPMASLKYCPPMVILTWAATISTRPLLNTGCSNQALQKKN